MGQVGHPGTYYPLIMPNYNIILSSGINFFLIIRKNTNQKDKHVKIKVIVGTNGKILYF